jgi:hypothetical protein
VGRPPRLGAAPTLDAEDRSAADFHWSLRINLHTTIAMATIKKYNV